MDRKRDIGRRIQEIRKRQGLSQEDVAGRADISPNYLSRIERGRENPTLDMILKLSDALGAQPRELFETGHLASPTELRKDLMVFAKTAEPHTLSLTLKLVRALQS